MPPLKSVADQTIWEMCLPKPVDEQLSMWRIQWKTHNINIYSHQRSKLQPYNGQWTEIAPPLVDDIHVVRQSVFADRQTGPRHLYIQHHIISEALVSHSGGRIKTNLSVLKEAFFKRFREDGCESDLDIVKQEDQESVDNFIHRFRLAACDFDLSDKHLVSRAIKNLKPAIRGRVSILKPKSMEDLREAAKTMERGFRLTSSSSSVNLSETFQATVNAAMTQMAQLMMTNTRDITTINSAPAQTLHP